MSDCGGYDLGIVCVGGGVDDVLSGAVVGKRVSVGWKAPVFLCGGGGDFLVGDG